MKKVLGVFLVALYVYTAFEGGMYVGSFVHELWND